MAYQGRTGSRHLLSRALKFLPPGSSVENEIKHDVSGADFGEQQHDLGRSSNPLRLQNQQSQKQSLKVQASLTARGSMYGKWIGET